jgi:threonine/homoserine/homoserine lactone efflux protein
MFISSLVQFIFIQISFAFSPGLIIALVVRTTLTQDRKSGYKVALGAAVGCLTITIFSAYIISFIVEKAPLILQYITYVGSFYIIYKAIYILKNSGSNIDVKNSEMPLWEGFKVNCLNPKMILLFLTVLPLFLNINENIFLGMIYLGLATTVINLIADISWCFATSLLRENVTINNRLVDRLAGLILFILGLGILINQILL